MIPCLWLTAGHVMGDPFEISTIRREVSISCREPSLPSMEHSIFSPTWLIKLDPLWHVCTEKRKSRGSVVVSLAYPRRAPRDFHLPLLSFGTIARHTLFFSLGAPPSLPLDLNPALGVINCHHYHTDA